MQGDEHDRLHRGHTSNLEAYEFYLRAKVTPYPPLPDRIRAAREMFEQVMVLDPDFAGGYAGAAWTLSFDEMWSHEVAGSVVDRAMALAQQAIKVDETFAWSYPALGFAFLNKLQHDEAIAASGQAIALQPHDADAHAHQGLILGISGQLAQGIIPLLARRRLLGPGLKRRRGRYVSHAVGKIPRISPEGLEIPKTHTGAGSTRQTTRLGAGGGRGGVGGLKPCAQ